MDFGLTSLFFGALLAATVLPFSSEAMVAAAVMSGEWPTWSIWLTATVGNVLGAQINWFLGRYCMRFHSRRWFPITPQQMELAQTRFQRWGQWSLLFAWVPVIGDPLTFIAGSFAVSFASFSMLVAIGKGARYLVILYFFS
ncbi:MAG: DedA family protein [Magnetococcales bacterium]|nr:DedA family protein [Magnetococcales bacterium]